MADPDISLYEEIESVRKTLNMLGNWYDYTHPEVMKCSQKLDKLLLKYYTFEQIGDKRQQMGG